LDPDVTALDVCVAVGTAGMVDKTRIIAVECRVDDPLAVQREQKGMMPRVLAPLIGIAAVRLRVADLFARVFDDLRSARNLLSRERPKSLDGRLAQLEPLVVVLRRRGWSMPGR